MKTGDIISEINMNFARVYRGAAAFVGSGAFWNFCISTISDPQLMSNIAFANDLGVPPVKSLLLIYRRTASPAPGFEFDEYTKKSMGALMGFIFKNVLGYAGQKDRCAVNELGVKTAARFTDGPVIKFS